MMTRQRDITGVILAGGRSRRLGEDKALLPIGGRPAIARAAALLADIFEHTLLSVAAPTDYPFLALPRSVDRFPGSGPLGGLHAALLDAPTSRIFAATCDMPLMSAEMIRYYIAAAADVPMVIARAGGRLQLLPGLYAGSLVPLLEEMLSSRRAREGGKHRDLSLHALAAQVETQILEPSGCAFYRDELYLNINTRVEYEAVLRRLEP